MNNIANPLCLSTQEVEDFVAGVSNQGEDNFFNMRNRFTYDECLDLQSKSILLQIQATEEAVRLCNDLIQKQYASLIREHNLQANTGYFKKLRFPKTNPVMDSLAVAQTSNLKELSRLKKEYKKLVRSMDKRRNEPFPTFPKKSLYARIKSKVSKVMKSK